LAEDQIVIHDEVNIGIAVALDDGLVVPVVRGAESKPVHQISEEIGTLAAKARAGNLTREEMQGGTFTVSNLASYGVDVFNPIINPPESAILGVCRIVERPAVVGGQVQTRSMMNLCLSFDHRVMDGVPAARYLARVKEILEAPYLLVV
jgi:pyruvate dehydrogenase E2 component (dihydrolipoamide acetyltransferase)